MIFDVQPTALRTALHFSVRGGWGAPSPSELHPRSVLDSHTLITVLETCSGLLPEAEHRLLPAPAPAPSIICSRLLGRVRFFLLSAAYSPDAKTSVPQYSDRVYGYRLCHNHSSVVNRLHVAQRSLVDGGARWVENPTCCRYIPRVAVRPRADEGSESAASGSSLDESEAAKCAVRLGSGAPSSSELHPRPVLDSSQSQTLGIYMLLAPIIYIE